MSRTFRLAAVQLALAAMMLRALLPMGWMPNPDGFAQSPLIICLMDMPSGMAMSRTMDMSKPMDMSGHGHGDSQQQSSEQCPFAAAPHVASPVTIADLAPPSTLSHFVVHEVADHSIIGAGHYQPQSPRAPPQIA
jgi:hypothetical protein